MKLYSFRLLILRNNPTHCTKVKITPWCSAIPSGCRPFTMWYNNLQYGHLLYLQHSIYSNNTYISTIPVIKLLLRPDPLIWVEKDKFSDIQIPSFRK